jgi:hypothetical protein
MESFDPLDTAAAREAREAMRDVANRFGLLDTPDALIQVTVSLIHEAHMRVAAIDLRDRLQGRLIYISLVLHVESKEKCIS